MILYAIEHLVRLIPLRPHDSFLFFAVGVDAVDVFVAFVVTAIVFVFVVVVAVAAVVLVEVFSSRMIVDSMLVRGTVSIFALTGEIHMKRLRFFLFNFR